MGGSSNEDNSLKPLASLTKQKKATCFANRLTATKASVSTIMEDDEVSCDESAIVDDDDDDEWEAP